MSITNDDGFIRVNYGHVDDVYDALVDADKSIEVVLENLYQVIGTLMQSWEGLSQESWAQIQSTFNADLTEMKAQLQASYSVLSQVATNYQSTDGNLAMQWSEIT